MLKVTQPVNSRARISIPLKPLERLKHLGFDDVDGRDAEGSLPELGPALQAEKPKETVVCPKSKRERAWGGSRTKFRTPGPVPGFLPQFSTPYVRYGTDILTWALANFLYKKPDIKHVSTWEPYGQCQKYTTLSL